METVYDLTSIINCKPIHGGMILDMNTVSGVSYGPQSVFLPSYAFDMLYNFITKATVDTMFQETDSFCIGDYVFTLRTEFRPEARQEAYTAFLEKVGIYQPDWTLSDPIEGPGCRIVLSQHVQERHLLSRAEHNVYQDRFASNVSWLCSVQPRSYCMIIPLDGSIVMCGETTIGTNPIDAPYINYVKLDISSVSLAAAGDMLSGLAAIRTLPEKGYKVTVSNGVGEMVIGNLPKLELTEMATRLIR